MRGRKLASGRSRNSILAKLLAQRQRLVLVGRSYVRAVDLVRARQQRHIVQPAYQLSVFHQEWDFVGSNFEHGWRPLDVVRTITESRIEKARVVNAELAV